MTNEGRCKADRKIRRVDQFDIITLALLINFFDIVSFKEITVAVESQDKLIRGLVIEHPFLPIDAAAAEELQAGIKRDFSLGILDFRVIIIELLDQLFGGKGEGGDEEA